MRTAIKYVAAIGSLLLLTIAVFLGVRAIRHRLVRQHPVAIAAPTSWALTKPANHHEVEGYASVTSARAGQTVTLFINSQTVSVRADVYRLGTAKGLGAERLLELPGLTTAPQPHPNTDPATGLIEAKWSPTGSFTIPSIWRSGLYLIKLTNAESYDSYIPLVVTDTVKRPALLVHSALTDQAYNDWGGNSLYRGSTPALHLPRAVNVSFNRPYAEHNGAGFMLLWEYSLVRFLEKSGLQVSYASDIDIHEHPELLQQYKTVIIAGHDEYWTKEMRDAYDAAVAHGVNVAVFAANTSYRQVRLEGRTEVGYKEPIQNDPLWGKDPARLTTNWRNPPVNRPESELLGAMYSAQDDRAYPLIIAHREHWVYAGTDLKNGDTINNMVGYESDKFYPDFPHPPRVEVLSQSPVRDKQGNTDISNMTLSTFANGAMVFNAGTVNWAIALDDYGNHIPHPDERIQKITLNVLKRFLGK